MGMCVEAAESSCDIRTRGLNTRGMKEKNEQKMKLKERQMNPSQLFPDVITHSIVFAFSLVFVVSHSLSAPFIYKYFAISPPKRPSLLTT
jgi:hypothetical protein